jgi:drug/metabolite transporter (DMT)-like permease
MSHPVHPSWTRRPAPWAIALALALVYVSWGTTYLAIREGVHGYQMPPALFGGVRVSLAGWIVLGFLWIQGESLRLPGREFVWIAVSGLLLFVCGNGLLTFALENMQSGTAAVLVTTTPLWVALLEMLWPWGDRLAARGWLGLAAGFGGVLLLLWPKIEDPSVLLKDLSPLLILGSSIGWAIASVILRYRRRTGSHLVAAAYQMILGGSTMALVGLAIGESGLLTAAQFTPWALAPFFYLLVVGSLVGFVAFNWLLGHVSATLVGTYAYVNPLVAILVGWWWGDEALSARIFVGMAIILTGVALVRGAGRPRHRQRPPLSVENAPEPSESKERIASMGQGP